MFFNGAPPFGAELLANNAIHSRVFMGKLSKGNFISKYKDLKLLFDNQKIGAWEKKWPNDILLEVVLLVKELAKSEHVLKKGDQFLTGAFGLSVPINDTNFIEVTSSTFGNVLDVFE